MEMIIAGTMLGASLIILLLSVLVMLLTRKNLVEYTAKLTRSLDAMISGTGEIAFEEEKETLVGRIQVKMRQLYEIMKSQNEKGARDKRQIEEIVGSISHQVRTPVASLRMYHEFLEREGLPEERRREFVRAEERQLDKLEFLMKSMIKMSRLETGLIAVRPEWQRVYDLIFGAVCDASVRAEKKEIDISTECSTELFAWYDRKWTQEALFNLLDNAVKYSPQGGRIRISAAATDYYVRICVEDQGCGIHEEALTDIFKRFYREPGNEDTEGLGIGLYLTRQIVNQEKGFVEVRSRKGEGSIFSLHLPLEKR